MPTLEMDQLKTRWEKYPKHSSFDPFSFDLEGYHIRLTLDSARLFLKDDAVCVQVIECGAEGKSRILKGMRQLKEYLLQYKDFRGTRVFQIPQQTSVGRLAISEMGLRILFHSIDVFPPFLDVVHAFGWMDGHDAAKTLCYQEQVILANNIEHVCYLSRHAEKHGREDQFDPWSIRRMGFYMGCNRETGQDNVIVINPSHTFQERLLGVTADSTPSASEIETLFLTTVVRTWRSYLDHMEQRLNRIKIKASTSSSDLVIDDNPAAADQDITKSDVRLIFALRHKLYLTSNALEANVENIHAVGSRRTSLAPSALTASSQDSVMRYLLRELSGENRRLQNLLFRLEGISGLIENTLSLRAASAAQNSSEMSNKLADIAREDSRLMLKLASKSQRDGRTLKAITILTLVYLPASFASTLLGMDYIHVSRSGPIRLEFDRELWVFLTLTVMFLVITMGAWLAYEHRGRHKAISVDEEKLGLQTQV